MSPLTTGTRLNSRFVLVDRIGSSTASQVWRATDELLDRPVAVKLLDTRLAGDPALRDAAWREARAATGLTHPNIAKVYDYGEAPLPGGGHAPYVVMELVEGEDLASRLASGPLPWPEAARIGACVAAALAAAHELGVVHRDVTPGNVLVTTDGAKVVAFGAPAPGHAAWPPAQPPDDVYAFGVLLRDALTGEASAEPEVPTGLPAAASELLRACLSPDPGQRPPARQVADTFAELAGAVPDPTAPSLAESRTVELPVPAGGSATGPIHHAGAFRSRVARVGIQWALAGLAAATALGLVFAVAFGQPRTEPPRAAPPPSVAPESESSVPSDPPPPASEPAETPADIASPESPGPRATLHVIRQTIRDARGTGVLDRGAARRLSDKLKDINKELVEKPNEDPDRQAAKVRGKVGDLGREIDRLEQRGEVPGSLATELRTLLPLVSYPA